MEMVFCKTASNEAKRSALTKLNYFETALFNAKVWNCNNHKM